MLPVDSFARAGTLAVVAFALVARSLSWLNPDTSALLTFAEKWLDGTDPYAVFNEINPPASILLYVPDVLVGRILGLSPEVILTGSLFVGTVASLWLTARIVCRALFLTVSQCWILAPFACAIFLLLPQDVFGEREHIAVITMLPLLALYAARVSGKPDEGWVGLIAGVGAGLAIVIKPYFALALLLPFTYAAYAAWAPQRRLKKSVSLVASREHLVIALVVAAYAITVILWFRGYLQDMLPIVQHVYLPVRFPWPLLVAKPMVILPVLGLAAVLFVAAPRALKPLPLVLVLAATGFWVAALIQGKGWPYHGYPAIALSLIASLVVAIERWPSQPTATWRVATIVLIGGLFALSAICFRPALWYPQFVSNIARVAPQHPRLMAICGARLEYLWPVSRILHGEAIGHGLWVNEVAIALENWGEVDQGERLIVERYAREERRSFLRAMRTRHPNVLVVCNDGWKGWALSKREFAAEMRKYHTVAQVERAEIWLPN